MKFSVAFNTFYAILLVAAISCSSDNDPHPSDRCVPQTLWAYGDSIVYDYAANGKLKKILYHVNKTIVKSEALEYDNKQRLSKVVRKYESQTMPYQTVQIVYDSNDKPERLNWWRSNTDSAPLVTNITHDDQGRLSIKSGPLNRLFRYEYDQNDNVAKVFGHDIINGGEVLARENHTFDNKKKFYANSADLKILNEYIFDHDPSQNNALTATIYYPYPNTKFNTPANVTFTTLYDDDGLITNKNNQQATDVGEFIFNFCKYKCE
jgi:hypothetical protein